MNSYMGVLKQIFKSKLGDSNYATFPIVGTHNLHSTDGPYEMGFWPNIHVVKGVEEADIFRIVINDLADLGYKEEIKDGRGRVAKYMAKLKKANIPPLKIANTWQTDSTNLRNAVDFLVQFEYKHKFMG